MISAAHDSLGPGILILQLGTLVVGSGNHRLKQVVRGSGP